MAVPSAPTLSLGGGTGGTLAIPGSGEIMLVWFPNGVDLLNFKIYRGASAGTVALIDTISSDPGDRTLHEPPYFYKDTTVVVATNYFYKVSSVNVDGESALSNAVQVSLQAYQTLTAPTSGNASTKMLNGAGSVGMILYEEDGETTGALDNFYVAVEGDYGIPSGLDLSIYAEYNDPGVYMKFTI